MSDFAKDTNVPTNDCISRQAAIDALEWTWAGKAAFDAIKNLPSAQPEQSWIPVTERLPEYDEIEGGYPTVIICHDNGVSVGFYGEYVDGGRFWFDQRSETECKVFAWMPLPEPYREEGDS